MHGDAQRRTPIQSFSSTVTTMTHTQVWTLSYVVLSLYAFFKKKNFYGYGFYWLAVMAPSSASVFVIDKWLFWGFNNDRNDIVAITFFVVVIVHLTSVVKPLLLCSLYFWTSSLLCYQTCLSSVFWNFLCSLFVNIQLIFIMFLCNVWWNQSYFAPQW